MKAVLKLSNCELCPYLEQRRVYTADSWENVTGWFCKKSEGKQITELDWYEKKPNSVPTWCPILERKHGRVF